MLSHVYKLGLSAELLTTCLSLNITAATRVHILEPLWNPFVEKQAIGRAVRYGQTRDVCVVRYIVSHSVESVSAPPPTEHERLGGPKANFETANPRPAKAEAIPLRSRIQKRQSRPGRGTRGGESSGEWDFFCS